MRHAVCKESKSQKQSWDAQVRDVYWKYLVWCRMMSPGVSTSNDMHTDITEVTTAVCSLGSLCHCLQCEAPIPAPAPVPHLGSLQEISHWTLLHRNGVELHKQAHPTVSFHQLLVVILHSKSLLGSTLALTCWDNPPLHFLTYPSPSSYAPIFQSNLLLLLHKTQTTMLQPE